MPVESPAPQPTEARPPVATPLSASLPFAIGLGIFFAAGILVTGALAGLVGSTETRYAEIAREMLASGDWLVPTLNGAPHLEKPPLTYWALALAFRLLGVGDVAARVPGLVAGALTVLVTAAAARQVAADRPDRTAVGRGAGLVLLTMPAFVLLARTVSTDVWLALFAAAAGAAVVASLRADGKPGWRWVLVLHVALGLGMLTKGPAVFLVPVAGAVAGAIATRSARSLRPWINPVGLLVLAAIGSSWYLLANERLPGLVDLYLHRRLTGGVFSGEHQNQPLWVLWGPVLLGGMPWAAALLGAIPTLARRGLLAPLLAMALATPVFFSFSASRGPTYGLAALPWLAVLVAAGAPSGRDRDSTADASFRKHLRRAAIVTAALVPVGSIAYYLLADPPFAPIASLAALVVALLASIGLLLRLLRTPSPGGATVALVTAALALAGGAIHTIDPSAVKANRRLVDVAQATGRLDEGEVGVAVHTDGDWGLLPFYAQRTGVFFGYSSGRVAPEPPEKVAPARFRPLDGPRGLAAWFRAPERRWLLLRTTVKNQERDPWARIADGPVVVVMRGDLYSVVTNQPLEPAR